MIGFIITRFGNWRRRDKLIRSHHRLLGVQGELAIQTAEDLQYVIDLQLVVLKRIADCVDDKTEQKKTLLDNIAKLESTTDARKALLQELKAAHAEIFPKKPAA